MTFATTTAGTFVDTIVLHGVGHNASGFNAPIADITLRIQGTVAPIPEPSTYALMLAGLGLVAWRSRILMRQRRWKQGS